MADVVARQRDIGIDLVNDGEYGHSMGQRYDYGTWWTYVFERLANIELTDLTISEIPQAKAKPGEIRLASFAERRDWQAFLDAYLDPTAGVGLPNRAAIAPVCRGPISYQGQDDVQRDIADMKAAMAAAGVSDGFLNSVAPGSCARFGNDYYADDEEMMYACADAMREEYTAIIDAGLVLQLDDPAIAENWDQINPAPSVEDYRRFTRKRVEALNYAIRGLPAERIRFHLCWGSWHGPHITDIPMADIVDVMLEINAGAYSFEAANVRHEHEWKIWRDVKLPDGQGHPARRGQPLHQRHRAPGTRRGPDRQVRRGGRPGERRRVHRLRPRRPRPPADRVGEARHPGQGRRAGKPAALGPLSLRWLPTSSARPRPAACAPTPGRSARSTTPASR